MARTTRLIDELPPTVPFLAPEAIERRSGKPLRVRLGANESGFGISPRALEAMRRAAGEVAWYGDPESYDLRARLAKHLGVGIDRIVVAAGIDDLLGMAVRCFVEPGQAVVTSHGSYPTFPYHVIAHGCVLRAVPYRGEGHDLEAIAIEAAKARARIVYLANPDNPTGSFLARSSIAALVERLPDECTLVLDEAYADFVTADELPAIDADDPRVLRLRTFSKAHGMAGARIGYAFTAAQTIKAFDKFRLHFGVNRVAQAGALASLDDAEFLASVVAGVEEGRRDYERIATDLGVRALPSRTNFVAFDLETSERARAVLDELLRDGVFVRVGAPPNDRLLRVTIGVPADRVQLAEALRRARTLTQNHQR